MRKSVITQEQKKIISQNMFNIKKTKGRINLRRNTINVGNNDSADSRKSSKYKFITKDITGIDSKLC